MKISFSLLITFISACQAQLSGSGDATYFTPGLGACGKTNGPGDFVVALSSFDYGDGPSVSSPVCGRCIQVNGPIGNVVLQVVDKCPGNECVKGSVDISVGAFSNIANKAAGRVKVTWSEVSCSNLGGGSGAPAISVGAGSPNVSFAALPNNTNMTVGTTPPSGTTQPTSSNLMGSASTLSYAGSLMLGTLMSLTIWFS